MERSRTTKIEQPAMESLPREIVTNIMSRLPTESLHNVKLVSKSWLNLAKDPVLVNLHFTRLAANNHCLILHCDTEKQLFALHFYAHKDNAGIVKKIRVPKILDFDVIGSCKGWLCLCDSLHKSTFHIYNPLTSDCIELPKSIGNSGDQWPVFGFGFHPATKEYKVLKIVNFTVTGQGFPFWNRRLNTRTEAHILTLGSPTPTWRNLGAIAYRPFPSRTQVLVNGRLHWVNWPCRYRPGRMLISFDLADEQFRELPRPDSAELERRKYNLVVLGGCLSAAFYCSDALFEVWIMKEYGVKESWTKGFRIGTYLPGGLEQKLDPSFKTSKFYRKRPFNRVLCGLKTGEILVEYECRALVSYDPKSETFRDITVQGMPNWFAAVVHTGSLDSVDDALTESI